ncbi:hypothetical protein R1flu_007577 [Riccia fluitans]|uniref:AB hydrolase-1 domain-containing protein n=1 Tax=Riccia fluitans TaxID=41844 RepID=A0ABD1Z037_9MARC
MAELSCLGTSYGSLIDRSFFSALQVCDNPKSLRIRKPRSGLWTPRKISVFLDNHELGLIRRADARKVGNVQKIKNRSCVVALAASGSLQGDGSWIQENNSEGDKWENERKRKKEETRRRIIAGVDQSQLVDPWLLADPDSRFAEYYGVQIHHKIARPDDTEDFKEEKRVRLPAILLHGFGASLFSWERVMPKLAQVLGEAVLAFDRPAFGLTSRVFPPSPQTTRKTKLKFNNIYSVAFSANAALAFVDFIQAKQAILIGHSAGSIIAAEAYHHAPEKIAAIIFVAPALVAPLFMRQMKEAAEAEEREEELEREVKSSSSSPRQKIWAAVLWVWSKFMDAFRIAKIYLALAFTKLLGLILRSPPGIWLVRRIMDKGGPAAVRIAFFDRNKADQYVLNGYTKPLGCRDWERALVEYCLALIETSEQISRKKGPEDIKCPVLVVTGDTDRIVPDWNAERLAKVFPNAEFKRIKNCGHLPQEETPDKLVEIIQDFLARNLVAGASTVANSATLVNGSYS